MTHTVTHKFCIICVCVLQCVAVCCSVLQCVLQCMLPDVCDASGHDSVLQCALQCVAECCNVLQCMLPDVCDASGHDSWSAAARSGGTRCSPTHCNTLQHTVTHCNALQCRCIQWHAATQCNSLQLTEKDPVVTGEEFTTSFAVAPRGVCVRWVAVCYEIYLHCSGGFAVYTISFAVASRGVCVCWVAVCYWIYGVATISRLPTIIGLFCRIFSLL